MSVSAIPKDTELLLDFLDRSLVCGREMGMMLILIQCTLLKCQYTQTLKHQELKSENKKDTMLFESTGTEGLIILFSLKLIR